MTVIKYLKPINYYYQMEMFETIQVSKVGDCSWGQPEGSLFSSYYTEV